MTETTGNLLALLLSALVWATVRLLTADRTKRQEGGRAEERSDQNVGQ